MATSTKKKPSTSPKPETVGYERIQADSGWLRLAERIPRIRLTPAEAHKILTVRDELIADDEKLEDGSPIATPLDAIRHILSRVQTDD